MTITRVGTRRRPGRVIEPMLDHLVYAVPHLTAAIEEFETATGVPPAEGGRHLGLGTRNYLVGLGPDSYLEIIGPDEEHPAAPGVRMPCGVDQLTGPTLLTWAVHPAELDRARADAAAAGADLGSPRAMSRRTPAGHVLRWRLASTLPLPFDGVTPFLIDWASTAHPAADPALPAVGLLDFSATHPDPVGVQRVLAAIGVQLPVESGPVGLRATVGAPNGMVLLS